MANTKISAFPNASALGGTEQIAAVQSAADVAITPTQIKTFLGLAVAAGKTITVSNTLTLAGTDSTVMTFPSTSATIARTDAGNTFTGAQSISGILTTQSGIVRAVRVVTASGAIPAATTDDIIIVNKTVGAATTVNLFATPTTGTVLTIKDGKGDAATNNVTITPAAGNIDGSATFVITTNYTSVDLVYNGTQWNVI